MYSRNIWKGTAAGILSGAAAAFLMTKFQPILMKLTEDQKGKNKSEGKENQKEPSTVKAAEIISKKIMNYKIKEDQKKTAGEIMHYSFGAAAGGLYGAAVEKEPKVKSAAGLPFGAGLWMAADNLAVPALGFSELPTKFPLSAHAYALSSHLVYGLTTEILRKMIRKIW
jgi:uncharacterized membrane protein YagU involved in acid resistance